MKIFYKIPLLLLLCFSLSACTTDTPETVVTSFCDAMQTFDITHMQELIERTENTEGVDDAEEMEKTDTISLQNPEVSNQEIQTLLMDYVKENAAKMTYTITNVEAQEQTANVTVQFTYPDLSPMMRTVMQEYIANALVMVFSGNFDDDDRVAEMFLSLWQEQTATFKPAMTSKTVVFVCKQTEEGWKLVEMPDAVIDVISGNIQQVLDAYDEAENGTDITESDTTETNTTEADPTGTNVDATDLEKTEEVVAPEPMPTDEALIHLYAETMYRLYDNGYGNTRDYTQTITVDGMTYVKLVGEYNTPETLYAYYQEVFCYDLAQEQYSFARSGMYLQDDTLYVVDADVGYLPEPENAVVLERNDYETLGEINMLLEIPCGDTYNLERVGFAKEDGTWKVASYDTE